MKPFKFFDQTWKQSSRAHFEVVSTVGRNPYQELVIDMIRECNRLNISLVGVQETVFNHRIMDIHIYNDWHGDNVDVTYLVDEGPTYQICGFNMGTQEFNTATSI